MDDLKQPYSGGYIGRVIVNKKTLSASIKWFNNIGYAIKGCETKSCEADCCHYMIPLTHDECENFILGYTFEKRFGKYCLTKESDNSPCSLLSKKNQCKDYNNRPMICRIYPFGIDPVEDESSIVYWIDKPNKCGAKVLEEKSETLDNDLIRLAINETKDELKKEKMNLFN